MIHLELLKIRTYWGKIRYMTRKFDGIERQKCEKCGNYCPLFYFKEYKGHVVCYTCVNKLMLEDERLKNITKG